MTENTMLPFERLVQVDIEEERTRGSLECSMAERPKGFASIRGLEG